MSRIRNSRTGFAGAVAATVALAALSLTACNDNSGSSDTADAAGTTATAPSASASLGKTSNTGGAGSADGTSVPNSTSDVSSSGGSSSGGSQSTDKSGGKAANGSSGTSVTCEASNTKMVAAPLNRPVNHLLLTVTNTGSKTCYLYEYPALQFTDAQSVPPVEKDSKPQAVTTLQPGQSGYASVALSASDGSGAHGRTAKSLTVSFYGRSGDSAGSVGGAAHPTLPAAGLYIDDSLTTTYWEQTMDDALAW